MSKTFKSVLGKSDSRRVHIESRPEGPNLWISDNSWGSDYGLTLAPSDAPALCLAILEAAVGENSGQSVHSERAIANLRAEVACMAERAAAEADRVKLEAEALKFLNAHRLAMGYDPVDSWDHFTANKTGWLAVARAARETNKETGQ